MEWENKFSSIVRETETNLARVRDRLGSTSKTKAFRPGSSGNRYDAGNLRSLPSRSAYNGTAAWDLQSSKHSPVKTVGMTTSVPSSQTSPALVNALFERVEEQAEIVSHLTDTVKRLEKEKDVQAAEIKKMKDEMSSLSERLREKGVDMETERKLEQFKRDVYSQLELVQSQAKLKLTSAENSSLSDSAVVNEARKMIEDETESLQREIKQLKTKLGKMEMDLHSNFAESRDVLRKQDRLDRALSSLSENQRSQSRSLSSLVDERQSASYEIQQLKQLVNKVSHQYSELESELQSSIRHSGFSSRSSSLRQPQQRGSRQTKITNGDSKPRTKGVKKKSENLVLSSSSDTDLSLTALDISSPSDTDLISSEFPRSNEGVSGGGLGNISSSSLSSLDSDDLLK